MKAKKLLAGILSAAILLGTVSFSAFADGETGSGSVKVKGIAGFEDKQYTTIQEAFEAISPKVEALAGFGETTCSHEAFEQFYTDHGEITWTITGKQTFTASDSAYLFSFGRQPAYYGENYLTAINIIGGDDTAELVLEQNPILPYDWWGNKENEMSASFSKLTLTAAGDLDYIRTAPKFGYKLNINYSDCTINGKFYSYWDNFALNLKFDNCDFNAPENAAYAIFTQGSGTGTITINKCNFTDYTRGVNFQKPNTDFVFTNNTIKSTFSEPDRGAVQITDGVSFDVTGNTIDVNGGNAFWFHSAATNSGATYTISDNNIKAPYLVNDDTTFGVNDKITCLGNNYNDTDTLKCMEKEAAEATQSTVVAMMPVAKIGDKEYTTLKDAMQAACNMNVANVNGIPTQTAPVTIELTADIENQKGFSVRGGVVTVNGAHYVHNVDITLNGNGHKIDTGVYGCNDVDHNPSPKIKLGSIGGTFTVKNVIAPNDLIFAVAEPDNDNRSACRMGEGGADSLTVEDCTFYGSNMTYPGAVKSVTYKNNKFLLNENVHDNPDAYPLWYKFDWKTLQKFTFEGNTVKSQRALNLARFAENSEIVVNNNNFAIANTENSAKSAAIMLAENHKASNPFNGNVTFSGNTVDAHSAVLVYTPSEYNTKFNFEAEQNTLLNDTKLVGYNEWSSPYSDASAQEAAEALLGTLRTTDKIALNFVPTSAANIYDIVLSGDGKNINRLSTADFTFKFDITNTTDTMSYAIAAKDGVTLTQPSDNRYAFSFNGKDAADETGAAITLGTVTFDGYGTFDFGVADAETNIVHAAKLVDNIVEEFVVGGGANKGILDISAKLTDVTIAVPTKDLTIYVAFNNAIKDNAAAYQDMTVTVNGSDLAAPIVTKLGTGVAFDATHSVYTVTIADQLTKNYAYTVTVEGAGYRTARYTVTMTADKTLNFWNNVKSAAAYIEEGIGTAKTSNFLAGDIVKDGKINIYDLSAVVSYFGTTNATGAVSPNAKYDLNRDGVIDSKDVAYVLVSWGE